MPRIKYAVEDVVMCVLATDNLGYLHDIVLEDSSGYTTRATGSLGVERRDHCAARAGRSSYTKGDDRWTPANARREVVVRPCLEDCSRFDTAGSGTALLHRRLIREERLDAD